MRLLPQQALRWCRDRFVMGDLSRVLHVATDREFEEILRSVTEKLVRFSSGLNFLRRRRGDGSSVIL